jgi:hypothetical protein
MVFSMLGIMSDCLSLFRTSWVIRAEPHRSLHSISRPHNWPLRQEKPNVSQLVLSRQAQFTAQGDEMRPSVRL